MKSKPQNEELKSVAVAETLSPLSGSGFYCVPAVTLSDISTPPHTLPLSALTYLLSRWLTLHLFLRSEYKSQAT